MNRQPTHPVRARLTVEALESRELPSASLAAFRNPASQPHTAQVRYWSPTIWGPSSPIWVPTTPRIIGILIAL
jgi:hypothetical protein